MRKFKLPELPYALDGLKPFLSHETLEYHYEKHHRGYVDKLNQLLEKDDSGWTTDSTLEDLVIGAEGALFNQAGQAWNHSFYWLCLSPEQTGLEGRMKQVIEQEFGSVEQMQSLFVDKGTQLFGSGWVWLVKDPAKRLNIVTTSNAENPLRQRCLPLLTCDVWEHAYYVDFRNERKKYLQDFFQHVNWHFVAENLASQAPANMTQLM